VVPNSSYTTLKDQALPVAAPGVLTNASDADNDTLAVIKYGQPAHGNLTGATGEGAFVYTPNLGYNGPDSFTFNVTDGWGGYAAGMASISIGGRSRQRGLRRSRQGNGWPGAGHA
jgi:hypothetical protein